MTSFRVAVIPGSLRRNAFSQMTAKALTELAPESCRVEVLPIGDLPLYNEDLETVQPIPKAWSDYRELIRGFDAFIFVTPEYNRSVPAALKNAVDVASRPYGKGVWMNKPAAVVSVSPGAIGGFGANQDLRKILACVGVSVMPKEIFIGSVHELFNREGALTNDKTREFLSRFMEQFADWVRRNQA